MPEIDWLNCTLVRHSKLGNEFLSIIQDNFLTQCVHEVTRFGNSKPNCLDLIFTSDPSLVKGVHVKPGVSEHERIVFYIGVKIKRSKQTGRKIYCFNK